MTKKKDEEKLIEIKINKSIYENIKNNIKIFTNESFIKLKKIKWNYILSYLGIFLKQIFKTSKKILKITFIIILLLTIGIGIGIFYGLSNPEVLDSWAVKFIDLDNSVNSYKEFKSYSYTEFSQEYLNSTKNTKNEILSAFRTGEINYEFGYSNILIYSYYTTPNCEIKNMQNYQLESCNYKSYQINKFNDKIWVFNHNIQSPIYEK